MLSNILVVAAKALVMKTKSQDSFEKLIKETGIAPERFAVTYDSSLPESEYIVESNNIKVNAKSLEDVKSIVSIDETLMQTPSEIDSIIKAVSALTEDPIRDLKSGAYNFMIFFVKDGESILKLKGIETQGSNLFISTDESLAKSLGASFPSVIAFNAKDKNVLNMPIGENVASLISAANLSYFSKIDQDSFKLLHSLDQPIFYIIDKKSAYSALREEMSSVMKPLSSKVKFVFFSPEEVPALIQLVGFKEADYPAIVSINKEGKYAIKNVNKNNLTVSVEDILNKKAVPVKFSSKIPADNESRAVKVLNTDTVLTVISKTTDKDRLIVFYSPSCSHCATLRPNLDKFASIIKDKNVDLMIGDYNIIENEQVMGFDVAGVPSLFLIKKGTTAPIKLPNEARSVKTLLEFISKEGASSKIDLDSFSEFLKEEEEVEEESEDEVAGNEEHAHSHEKVKEEL